MTPMQLEAERYSPSGSIAADGVQRLLGTPHTGRLRTLIRETGQNSSDAATSHAAPEYRVRIRSLSGSQLATLRETVFRELPSAAWESSALRSFLHRERGRVIEICDFGTKGLAGPVRADTVTAEEEPTDFVDFVRNVGSRRDTYHGGGTYGYGKASLYLASACRTILIDSLTSSSPAGERRLIASNVSEAYAVDAGPQAGRYTGRHWWGTVKEDGLAEPYRDDAAVQLAEALGLARRGPGDTGTTLVILDPDLEEGDNNELPGAVIESLLWDFWPRMIGGGWRPPMTFRVEHEGNELELPDPSRVPPFRLFVDALRRVRQGGSESTPIVLPESPLLPRVTTGHLAVKDERVLPRRRHRSPENTLIPDRCHHIALMRPAELVVRYLEGTPSTDEEREWCGVFVCSGDVDVERAFADAEPPAHDDWVPDNLPPRSHTKRIVRDTLRELKRAAVGARQDNVQATGESRGLAGAANFLGRAIGLGDRSGSAATSSRGGRRRGTGQQVRIGEPEFHGLEEWNGRAFALFKLVLSGRQSSRVVLTADARVVSDGGRLETTSPNGAAPAVLGWRDAGGYSIGDSPALELEVAPGETELQAVVDLPDTVGVTLKVTKEEQ